MSRVNIGVKMGPQEQAYYSTLNDLINNGMREGDAQRAATARTGFAPKQPAAAIGGTPQLGSGTTSGLTPNDLLDALRDGARPSHSSSSTLATCYYKTPMLCSGTRRRSVHCLASKGIRRCLGMPWLSTDEASKRNQLAPSLGTPAGSRPKLAGPSPLSFLAPMGLPGINPPANYNPKADPWNPLSWF